MTIKELRKITGLTQVEFGEKYGISAINISRWETGEYNAPKYFISLLERVITELDYKESADMNMTFYEKQLHDNTHPTLQMKINANEVEKLGKTVNEFMVPIRYMSEKFGITEVEPDKKNHIYTFYTESANLTRLAQIALHYDDETTKKCFTSLTWVIYGNEENWLE